MPRWTEDQAAAIAADNPTLLISAAAGSGKTAVLVARILRLVRQDHAHLNRMLIVTFTRAAAGEMRDRLKKGLTEALLGADSQEAPYLRRALDELGATDIATIDAFCRQAIREEFQLVGVDPASGVMDENEAKRLFQEAFHQATDTLLTESGSPDYHAFIDAFTPDERLRMTEGLYNFLMAMPQPEKWLADTLERTAHTPMDQHPWVQVLWEQALVELQSAQLLFHQQEELLSGPDGVASFAELLAADRQSFAPVLEACAAGDTAAIREALPQVSFAKAPIVRGATTGQKLWKDQYNKLRKELKDLHAAWLKLLVWDMDRYQREIDVVSGLLRGLSDQVWATKSAYDALKARQHMLDFPDMGQLTLKILSNPDCRASLQQQYDHIFVDECQDVSRVQDAIFNGLHSGENHLFMVGDIKQSIYRFRLADPSLFLGRIERYSKDAEAPERKIVLKKNFRSAWPVLDAANRVFAKAMRRGVTEIDYTEDDELVLGSPTETAAPVEVHLVRSDGRLRTADCLAAEAQVAGECIRNLLTQELTDKNGTRRRYRYSDICILMARTATHGEALRKLLEAQGIPVFFDGKGEFYQLPEIRTMKTLLEAIDNPLQDIPLLAALKLRCMALDEHDLAAIRLKKQGRGVPFYLAFQAAAEDDSPLGEKCRAARDRIAEWRFQRENMLLSDYLWYLLRDTGLFAQVGALPAGDTRQANLRLLVEKAVDYENQGGRTLRGFIDRLNIEMTTSDSATTAKVLGEQDNVVRLMTMHKSKGLEFPAVLLMRLTTPLSAQDRNLLTVHEQLGLCLPFVNTALSIRRDAFGQQAFDYRVRQDRLAESCRLLYVAMTRARERLILTGCVGDTGCAPDTWTLPEGDLRVWKAKGMMDWVMQSVLSDLHLTSLPEGILEDGTWKLQLHTPVALETLEEAAAEAPDVDAWLAAAKALPVGDSLWTEPQATPTARRVLKTSVTSLIKQQLFHDPLALFSGEETIEDKRTPEYITQPLSLSPLPSQPEFLREKQMTAADKGTLMHRLLCLAPLEQLRGKSRAEMTVELSAFADALMEKGVFTPEERGLLRPASAAAFYAGALGQRLLSASEVRREWPFNLQLKGGTLLQGVIDSAFMEDGAWIICDYKTDWIDSEEAFLQRHTPQLQWYAQALGLLLGQPVREAWLYSIRLEKAMRVELV